MHTNIILIFGVVIVLQAVALCALLKKGQASIRSAVEKKQVESVLKVMDAYNKLTAIKWYTDMMLSEETGPLNIAQLQFLHKIADDSQTVIAELRSASQELRSSISNDVLMEEGRKMNQDSGQ